MCPVAFFVQAGSMRVKKRIARDYMLKFISWGSGSSGNCYGLFTEDDGLLIDAGVGIRKVKKYFREYGFRLSQVRAILITHDHADHIKAAGVLSASLDVPVYTTALVHQGILENRCAMKAIPSQHRLVIGKNVQRQIGQFLVTPIAVPHDSRDNVGYKIVCRGITFCVMTDAGHVTDEMASCIGEADYLVIEANHDEAMLRTGPYPAYLKARISGGSGHLSNRCCGEALARCLTGRTRHVWLCHLSQENNTPQLALSTVRSMLQSREDLLDNGLVIEVLERTRPTGDFDLML